MRTARQVAFTTFTSWCSPGTVSPIRTTFDLERRTIDPPIPRLSRKHFALLLYLALRSTTERPPWVTREEIVQRVPLWVGQKPKTAGQEIGRLDSRSFFAQLIDFEVGPNAG